MLVGSAMSGIEVTEFVHSHGGLAKASKALGISRNTLQKLMGDGAGNGIAYAISALRHGLEPWTSDTDVKRQAAARAKVRELDAMFNDFVAFYEQDAVDQKRYRSAVTHIVLGLTRLEASFLPDMPPMDPEIW